MSELRSVEQGVPQGSILGPLLFTLYVADFPNSLLNSKVIMYAGDIQLLLSFIPTDLQSAVEKIQTDLDYIIDWSSQNALMLNPQKTIFMIIDPSNKLNSLTKPKLAVLDHEIESVDDAKTLGL